MRRFTALGLVALLAVPAFPQETPDEEAARKKLTLVPGLQASLWASTPLLANPVALSIDEKGRVYVAECWRRHTSTLDIHMRKEWLDDDLACRKHEDQIAYHERRLGETATGSPTSGKRCIPASACIWGRAATTCMACGSGPTESSTGATATAAFTSSRRGSRSAFPTAAACSAAIPTARNWSSCAWGCAIRRSCSSTSTATSSRATTTSARLPMWGRPAAGRTS